MVASLLTGENHWINAQRIEVSGGMRLCEAVEPCVRGGRGGISEARNRHGSSQRKVGW